MSRDNEVDDSCMLGSYLKISPELILLTFNEVGGEEQ
jgi:hypothetical protein